MDVRLTYNGVCGTKAIFVHLIEIFVVTTRLLCPLDAFQSTCTAQTVNERINESINQSNAQS